MENLFAKGGPYFVGERMTIADLLVFHETTNLEVYGMDLSKWKKVNEWYNLMISNEEVGKIYKNFQVGKVAFAEALNKVKVE